MTRSLLLLLGLFAIGLVLFVNIAPLFEQSSQELHFTHADVRGMAIEHEELLYTLSFDQQEAVITMINRSLPVEVQDYDGEEVPFTSIVIYQFDKPDITLKPVAYLEDGSMIFTLDSSGYLRDISAGKMKAMFPTMYDQ